MSTYFISDLHLSPQQPNLLKLFEKFLSVAEKNAERIYILGDFFDRWIGDDDVNPFTQHACQLLKRRANQGIELYFMHGNRDFLIGPQFAKQSGCQLIDDPCVIDLYGKPCLLKHGDDLCLSDKKHQLFRSISRHRLSKSTYLSLPLTLRRKLAQLIQNKSEQHKLKHANSEIMDITPSLIPSLMQQYNVCTIIHGHTHRPTLHLLSQQQQWQQHIVLSDWGKRGNYLVYNSDHDYLLNYFNA